MFVQKTEKKDRDFNRYLDNQWEKISILGKGYSLSLVLRRFNPDLYNQMMKNWYIEEKEVWMCGECGEEFNDEKEAEKCCR